MIYKFNIVRKGIPNLNDKSSQRITIGLCFIILFVWMFLWSLPEEDFAVIAVLVTLLSAAYILFYWLQSEISRRLEERRLRRETEEAESLRAAAEQEAANLHLENADLRRQHHRDKEVIPALRAIMASPETAADPEWKVEVERLADEQEEETKTNIRKLCRADRTGLKVLDLMLRQFCEEAGREGIDFDVKVFSPVAVLVDSGVIPQLKLQQLIGDLLRNAFRAVKRGGKESPAVLIQFGNVNGAYEIDISDSGPPFPKEVLCRLGKRGVTTGGTGNGIADVFELCDRCKASFDIEDYPADDDEFIKRIVVRFDGRNTRMESAETEKDA